MIASIKRFVKYLFLIPVRILYLPRIYRKLIELEASNRDLQRRMLTVEEAIRATHSDLQRRMLMVEEAIRATHPDLQRRMLMVEEAIRATHPDLQRRMLTVEEAIRMANPNEQKKILDEARNEYYVAQTMLKAIAANLRESKQTAEELRIKQEILEKMKLAEEAGLEIQKIQQMGWAEAIRDLTQDVNRLKALSEKTETRKAGNGK